MQPGRKVIEIAAVPPPRRWGWIVDVLTFSWLPWLGPVAARAGDPTQVVVRYGGRERLLFWVDSLDDAKVKVERVALEYERMNPAEWCERYGVPVDFFAD
jgi:hypothetical protein